MAGLLVFGLTTGAFIALTNNNEAKQEETQAIAKERLDELWDKMYGKTYSTMNSYLYTIRKLKPRVKL